MPVDNNRRVKCARSWSCEGDHTARRVYAQLPGRDACDGLVESLLGVARLLLFVRFDVLVGAVLIGLRAQFPLAALFLFIRVE